MVKIKEQDPNDPRFQQDVSRIVCMALRQAMHENVPTQEEVEGHEIWDPIKFPQGTVADRVESVRIAELIPLIGYAQFRSHALRKSGDVDTAIDVEHRGIVLSASLEQRWTNGCFAAALLKLRGDKDEPKIIRSVVTVIDSCVDLVTHDEWQETATAPAPSERADPDA